MSEAKTAKVKLDWSRLLGFDQADSSGFGASNDRCRDARLVKLGTKRGAKLGAKLGQKTGVKAGIKMRF